MELHLQAARAMTKETTQCLYYLRIQTVLCFINSSTESRKYRSEEEKNWSERDSIVTT